MALTVNVHRKKLKQFFLRVGKNSRIRLAQWINPESTPKPTLSNTFYPQQASCQIPNLPYLLSLYLGERTDGFYVEVGANDGIFVSNTWGLAWRGWHGILIEPLPDMAEKCRSNYAEFSNVRVVETAVGDNEMDLTLFMAGTLTTANPRALQEYSRIDWAKDDLTGKSLTVPCRTLDNLLMEYGLAIGFDLLVVDVEGFESEVFLGFELQRWLPKMLIVELVETHPDLTSAATSDYQLGEKIISAGYHVVYKDAINTVFVRSDIRERVHS
jgi:FkbM family methyltransferase